jgi:predicted dehydrogenase
VRIAFAGVAHWHSRHYINPLIDRSDVEIAGFSDPDVEAARKWAAQAGGEAFADYRTMCERVRPDLVVALGRHIDMADQARYLLSAGYPSILEKPCGVNVEQVRELEALAAETGTFAAVPFAYRYSRMCELITGDLGGADLTYGLFRQIPGPAGRYREWGVGWNLDPRLAGGGCTLNLSIHFYDLARFLAPGAEWSVQSAAMSSRLSGEGVEDFSATLLTGTDGRRAVVETGYAFPGAAGDTSLAVVNGGDYVMWDGNSRGITVTRADGAVSRFDAATNQSAYYGAFLFDVIGRVRDGREAPVTLSDMLAAAEMAERAYRLAGRPDLMS